MPTLIVLTGLPGVGKSSVAQALLHSHSSVFWVRIDSIETGLAKSVLAIRSADDAGYCAAYRVAGDNLTAGRVVVADSVNPVALTRRAWSNVAERTNAMLLNVELVCSDLSVHESRVEKRRASNPNRALPGWNDVLSREYSPWDPMSDGPNLRLDSAEATPAQLAAKIWEALPHAE